MNISKFNHKAILIAIYLYLDNYFEQGLDELGAFLSSLSPIGDGSPADPALYHDWCEIINNKSNLGQEEAYHCMLEFLKMESNLGWSEIGRFMEKENLKASNKQINIKQFARWNDAINKALEYNLKY